MYEASNLRIHLFIGFQGYTTNNVQPVSLSTIIRTSVFCYYFFVFFFVPFLLLLGGYQLLGNLKCVNLLFRNLLDTCIQDTPEIRRIQFSIGWKYIRDICIYLWRYLYVYVYIVHHMLLRKASNRTKTKKNILLIGKISLEWDELTI